MSRWVEFLLGARLWNGGIWFRQLQNRGQDFDDNLWTTEKGCDEGRIPFDTVSTCMGHLVKRAVPTGNGSHSGLPWGGRKTTLQPMVARWFYC